METNIIHKIKRWTLAVIVLMQVVFSLLFSFVNPQLSVVQASNDRDAVASMQVNAGGDSAVTGEVIDDWISGDSLRKGSRLDGYGDKIVEVADKNGLNRAFFVALIDAETSMGVNACFGNDYNFGCIRNYSGNSVEEGLEDLGTLLAKYVDGTISVEMQANPTIQQFTDVYAPQFENDHESRFANHGAVFGFLGVDAGSMQESGALKNGGVASSVDYTAESRSLASSCPINCDLVPEQRVNDYNNGANTGNLQILPDGQTWKNESSLLNTDLGYTSDQATRANLKEFLESYVTSDNAESYADYFYEAGQLSGLDPRFLVAFWSVNTNSGTSEAWTTSNNAFGWTTGGNFSTPKEGIIEGSKLISINYYNDGQKTLNAMVEDDAGHIVSADEDWAVAVGAIMQKSEDFIGVSTGRLPQDMALTDKDTWIYEQCFGDGGTGINLTGGNYTEQVINYLRSEGLTNESIAGILGNMQKESGISPTRLQGHGYEESENMSDAERDRALANKTKGAYAAGIVQWEEPRFNTVRAKASELGVSPFTMEPQMYILVQELKTIQAGSYGSGNLYDLYTTNTDIFVATASFAERFERCRACRPGTGEFEQRDGMARELYATYF